MMMTHGEAIQILCHSVSDTAAGERDRLANLYRHTHALLLEEQDGEPRRALTMMLAKIVEAYTLQRTISA